MARKRMIDPSFWSDEKLGSWSREERLLFMGLISNADDEGRLPGHPALLKAAIFPYDTDVGPGEVAAWLEGLAAKGLVAAYEAGGEAVVWVKNFNKHQTIKKPTPSKLPPPPAGVAGAVPAGRGSTHWETARRGGSMMAIGAGAAAAPGCFSPAAAAAVGEPARTFTYGAGPEAGDRPGTAYSAAEGLPAPGAAPIPPATQEGPDPAGLDPVPWVTQRRDSRPDIVAAGLGECGPAAPALTAPCQDIRLAGGHEGQNSSLAPPIQLRQEINPVTAVQDVAVVTAEQASDGEVPGGPRPPGTAWPDGEGPTLPAPDEAEDTAGDRPGRGGQAPCPPGPEAAAPGITAGMTASGGRQFPDPPAPVPSHPDGGGPEMTLHCDGDSPGPARPENDPEQAPQADGFIPAAGDRGAAPAPASQEVSGDGSSAKTAAGSILHQLGTHTPLVPCQFGTSSPSVTQQAGTDSPPVPPKRREEKRKEREEKGKGIVPASPPAAAPAAPAGRRTTKVFKPDSTEYRLAKLLREMILANLPSAKVPGDMPEKLAPWCREIDLLLRVDRREPGEVERVIRWCQQDPFWRANILSPRKLREKWDTLVLQMRRKEKPRPGQFGPPRSADAPDKYRALYRLA